MSFVNPYEALALAPDATAEQIKYAYRQLAKRYHPDSASNAGHPAVIGMFQQVTEAYELLSDPDKRRKYDAIRQLLERKPAPTLDDFTSPPGLRFSGSMTLNISGRQFSGSSFMFSSVMGSAPVPVAPIKVSQSITSGLGNVIHLSVKLRYTQTMLMQARNNVLAAYMPGNMYVENGQPVGLIQNVSTVWHGSGDLDVTLELLTSGISVQP